MTTDPEGPSLLRRFFRRKVDLPDTADGVDDTPTEKAAAQERMMDAAERFHLLRVDDVMVPRADIVAVEKTATLKDLTKAFREAGHSRLPVYEDGLDNPIGMVHIKDILPYLMFDARGRTAKTYPERKVIRTIKRDVLYVPPSMLAQDLLRRMQARRMHMAIVVDEYGGTDGLVTIEDLIEPIVGDIEDEHDEMVDGLMAAVINGNRTWESDARVTLTIFESELGRPFVDPDQEEDIDTLGGLVFTLAGRVPERGEIIKHTGGLEFEVLDADPRRVKRLRIIERLTVDDDEEAAPNSSGLAVPSKPKPEAQPSKSEAEPASQKTGS